jgi:RNA polymerase sigma factor (sigma-70 family)
VITNTATINKARNGDGRAFDQLIADNWPYVRSICQRFFLNADDGDAAALDTFMRLRGAIAAFEGDGIALQRWLLSVARRVSIDRVREIARVSGHTAPIASAETAASSAPSPEDRVMHAELLSEVRQTISEEDYTLLIFSTAHAASYRELAFVTGINEATLRQRISRIKARLRKTLGDSWFA